MCPLFRGKCKSTATVLDKGSEPFDNGGAWINAAAFDGTKVRAWYHAEQRKTEENCSSYVHRSIAYAESPDGQSFTKDAGEPHDYPNNKVLDSGNPSECRSTGLGDHSAITWNNDYYIYFIDHSAGGQVGVARSSLASWGKPGSWSKWCFDGVSNSFATNCPGVGGNATFLSPGYQGIDASIYSPDNMVVLLYQNWDPPGFNGLQIQFMSDPTTFASSISEPLLYYKNEGYAGYGEQIYYASIVPPVGGKNWSDSFYLYYLYLQPGEGFDDRYQVRRKVDVIVNPAPISPQVRVALTSVLFLTVLDI